MGKHLKRDSNTISLATFYENYLMKKYNFDPPYQRHSVWTDEKQSFLIDSILRNFPIPPIFLHQHIDAKTGRTRYDVIDGKQRLTSIIRFIDNKIAVTSEEEEDGEVWPLAGKKFSDLDAPELDGYKQVFWRYQIPVEYIDTDSHALVDNIFDRLNRNGEPLVGQELRKAKYNDSALLCLVEDACKIPVWADRLKTLDEQRMGDREFVSELIFVLLEDGPCEGRESRLDDLYAKHAQLPDAPATLDAFKDLSKTLHDLGLDVMADLGVSHVYGIWCFLNWCKKEGKNPLEYRERLEEFYAKFQADDFEDPAIKDYKNSVSWATRTKGQRNKRMRAIIQYLNAAG